MRSWRIIVAAIFALGLGNLFGCGATGSDGSNGVPAVAGVATEAPASTASSLPPCAEVPITDAPISGADLAKTFWVQGEVVAASKVIVGVSPGDNAVGQLITGEATLRSWHTDGERTSITVYTGTFGGDASDAATEPVVLVTSSDTRYPIYLAPSKASACGLANLIDEVNAVAQDWAPGTGQDIVVASGAGFAWAGTMPVGE